MEFFCYHRDRPGSTALRGELLEAHWSYMDRYTAQMPPVDFRRPAGDVRGHRFAGPDRGAGADRAGSGGRLVAVEGTWTLSVDTPIGEQRTMLVLHRDGDRLTGSLDYRATRLEITDGVVSGDEARWKVVKTLNKLLKVNATVTFTVTVEGDSMRGKADAGKFGTFDVTGLRG
ncbi:hypothetical protein GCM10010399_00920 [Dactylosporangium fulvum]|uniref:Uncharacterized protein n=1 Tax=Dactylosporangium fulvum TaxID=53359 RepID=A0ABY5VPH2_9ACTN|nr:hypothetical protein [Dactylosporangium fulvum]UWP79653.1 hypothetical protein Dfulv_31390 [Dactylosporangium fulvum]